jgi:hypothetical protein
VGADGEGELDARQRQCVEGLHGKPRLNCHRRRRILSDPQKSNMVLRGFSVTEDRPCV